MPAPGAAATDRATVVWIGVRTVPSRGAHGEGPERGTGAGVPMMHVCRSELTR